MIVLEYDPMSSNKLAASERPRAKLQMNTWWPLILTVVLILTQLVYPSKVWIVLLWMVGGLSVLAYLWARRLQQHVTAERRLR